MHISKKGQVTIPVHMREKYDFLPHSGVEFIESNSKVFIKLIGIKNKKISRGKKLVKHLRGRATVKMGTEEIMRLTRGNE